MCNLQILTHSENGYVVQCEQCRHFQLAFGTAVVCFSEEELVRFERIVRETGTTYEDDGFPDRKNINLPLFSENVQLIVSIRELHQLQQLISEAWIMKETNKLLSQHDNSSQNTCHGS